MSLKYLGVGLSKTGTTSLFHAMLRLGFKSLHWEPERLSQVALGNDNQPDFKIYDDCEFICDIPHAYFYREIGRAYPGLKYILTVRDEEAWFRSMVTHFKTSSRAEAELALHRIVYGGSVEQLTEFLYRKRFREWNESVRQTIPAQDLLVMNICDDKDGYAKLCPFVGKAVLDETFPHGNKTQQSGLAPAAN
jgi:hypothetical protein